MIYVIGTISFIFFCLLLVGSFYLGRHVQRRSSRRRLLLSKHYFVGLNYLLNEQPDKAVDIFIRTLSVNSDTFETHLAIGNLFRRRGEVERAIRIHQNLISEPNLGRPTRVLSLLELGRDYMTAGLYDRAERLLLEAIDLDGKLAFPSLKYLIAIYEHEKEWMKAIEYARLLQARSKENWGEAIANYYCQWIESQVGKLTDREFNHLLQEALLADPNCVRAHLIEAKWHESHGDYRSAIRAYGAVREQRLEYLSETLAPMVACYEKLNDEAGLRDYLYQCLNDRPNFAVIQIIAEKLQAWHGAQVAADFLSRELKAHPSLMGVSRLSLLYGLQADEKHRVYFEELYQLLQYCTQNRTRYTCIDCGFSSQNLMWQCPGCHHWNTVKPLL